MSFEAARRASPLLERFELGEKVGEGAYGAVFRAMDRATGRLVAVKQLHGKVADEFAADRFEREARLLASVNDPHVVGFVEYGVDDGSPWLALEWLQGEDLATRRRRGALPLADALDVLSQVAWGLEALHRAGVVHRDVKPSNIVIVDATDGMVCKLVDLGVALAGDDDRHLTAVGMRLGTPSYMSPEQVRGEAEVSFRTDLYSLGVVGYQLISGERPFRAEDALALLARILLEEPRALGDLARDTPSEVLDVIAIAMRKRPEDRFTSAREMAERLTSARSRIGIGAKEMGTSPTATVSQTASTSRLPREKRVVPMVFARVRAGEGKFESLAADFGGTSHRLIGGHGVALFARGRSIGEGAARAAGFALALSREGPSLPIAISTSRVSTDDEGLQGEAIDRAIANLQRASGRILLDTVTARLLGDRFSLESLGDDAWALTGELLTSRDRVPSLLGRETPTVGRERELGLLESIWLECLGEGVARVALVTGAAGIGKSRVRHEFLRRARMRAPHVQILLGRGSPVGAGSAFALLGDAIRSAIGLNDGAKASLLLHAIRRVGSVLGPDQVERVAGDLVGMVDAFMTAAYPSDDVRRDAVIQGDRIRQSFELWMNAESLERPILLVLEDLQWGDTTSTAMISALLGALSERSLMVLALARPEVHERFPRLWSDRALTTVALPELGKKAAERLVRSALPDAPDSQVVALVERTGGNAFFLEELIRCVGDGKTDGLPDTVFGVVQSRLDDLRDPERRLAQVGSVFGRSFWKSGVAACSLLPAESVQAMLDTLVASELCFVREPSRFEGDTELVFRHAIVRDVAYESLADDDRRAVHARVAAWLEAAGEHDPMVLVEHLERSGAPERAMEPLYRAAERALQGNDFEAAIAHVDRALQRGPTDALRGALLLLRAEACKWNGDMLGAVAAGTASLELIPQRTPTWYHAAAEAAAAEMNLGRTGMVEALAERLERDEEAGRDRASAVASYRTVVNLFRIGMGRRAETLFGVANERSAALLPDPLIEVWRLCAEKTDSEMRGEIIGRLGANEEIAKLFILAGEPRAATTQKANAGAVLMEVGRHEEAVASLQEARAAATKLGVMRVVMLTDMNLVLAHARCGRLDEAIVAAQRAAEAAVRLGNRRIEAIAMVHLALGCIEGGDLVRAEQAARRACEAAGALRGIRAAGLAALADVHLSRGEPELALPVAREAYDIASELAGIETGGAHVECVYAEALHGSGHHAEAVRVISVAHAALLARSELVTDPALRQTFLERMPPHRRIQSAFSAWVGAGAG